MDITAVTSIGGKGTRLKDISKGLPKALIKINGKTVENNNGKTDGKNCKIYYTQMRIVD